MENYIYFDNRALMVFCLIMMVSLTIIIAGYYMFGQKYSNIRLMIWGNITYTFFFLIIVIDTMKRLWQFPVVIAFLDLTSTILWVMGLNSTIGMKHPKRSYAALSIINVIAVSFIYYSMGLKSMARASTTLMISFVLVQTTYRLFKSSSVRKLDAFKFTGFSMIMFSAFKIVMSLYRMMTTISESELINKDISIAVFTLVSLVFAVWINFTIAYLNHDILRNEIEELSLRDHLTKLPNRRMIMIRIEELMELYKRSKLKFAIAIFDLDNFKNVNDNYGHNVGDEVLKGFASLLNNSIRAIDMAGRYGGEEFLVILQVDDCGSAKMILERVRLTLNQRLFSEHKIGISVSGGVAMADESGEEAKVEELIAKADKRLYKAKDMGKDRIVYEDV